MLRVAVCLTGEMRGCPECIRLLKVRVIQPFLDAKATVDLFIHTRKDPWWLPASELPFRCLWVEENRLRDTSPIVSEANPNSLGADESQQGRRVFLYQSYMQQYWSMAAVGEMKRRAEKQDDKLYDWVVRSRPDVYLEDLLPVEQLTPGCVNIPWNDWWPYEMDGVRVETAMDKFAVGPSEAMDVYLNKLDWLQRFCSKYRLQGEAFTTWQLNQAGIKWQRHDKMKCVQTDVLYKYSLRPDREA